MAKKKKYRYPQVIQFPFKAGDWIVKKNKTSFPFQDKHGVKRSQNCVKINHAFNTGNFWLINNKYQLYNTKETKALDLIEIISEEQAMEINKKFSELYLTEPEATSIEETCFTNYSGERQEKVKYNTTKHVLSVLSIFMAKRPDDGFQAYKCPNCGFYHIGRKKEQAQSN